MHPNRSGRIRLFTASAAALAAVLYASRSGQAVVAGELDHMAHTVSSGQPLVIAAAGAMAAALLGLRLSIRTRSERLASPDSASLLLAAAGLLWAGTARLIELLGASGPWGLYSGPGFLASVVGLAVAGLSLARTDGKALGRVLLAISALRATAGLVSMTLFQSAGA